MMNQSTCDGHPLLFSTRKLAWEFMPLPTESNDLKQLIHFLSDFLCASTVYFKCVRDIFEGCFLRQEFVVLENCSNIATIVRKVSTVDIFDCPTFKVNDSLSRFRLSIDQFQECRFSCTTRTDQRNELTRKHGKRNLMQGINAARVILGNILKNNNRLTFRLGHGIIFSVFARIVTHFQ
jgi:hypothetical protein